MKPQINTINAEQSLIMNKLMRYYFGDDVLNAMPRHLFVDRYNELCSYFFSRAYLPNERVDFNPDSVDVSWNGSEFEVIYLY